MKMYWCVTSTYYDDGRCTAYITDCVNAEKKPNAMHKEMKRFDIWNDWFDSREKANLFMISCRS